MTERHRVRCIDPVFGSHPDERIGRIGGTNSVGVNWRLTQAEAVAAIESRRWDFYVHRAGRELDVIVATTSAGAKYLKTTADAEEPASLLDLPACS